MTRRCDRGLALLRGGAGAEDVLSTLTAEDAAAKIRQAAVLDCSGKTAAHTGSGTIAEAGHNIGSGYSVQANMMLNNSVPAAMSTAFENTGGRLQDRLMSALNAAQAEGGDIRGMQSAAMLIVSLKDKGNVRDNTVLDLRVEDNPFPLVDLERLLKINDAYVYADLGDQAMEEGNTLAAMEAFRRAENLQPDNIELQFWRAVSHMNNNEPGQSRAILKQVIAADARWFELLKRLHAAGLISKLPEINYFI